MAEIAVAESFIDALTKLDPSDTRRAAAFLTKLVTDPSAPGLRPRIVHDAADRTIRSINVTHDLRAIAHVDGDRIVLLHVARHDRAYVWARTRCITCHEDTGVKLLTVIGDDSAGTPLRFRVCSNVDDICRLLDENEVLHALR